MCVGVPVCVYMCTINIYMCVCVYVCTINICVCGCACVSSYVNSAVACPEKLGRGVGGGWGTKYI